MSEGIILKELRGIKKELKKHGKTLAEHSQTLADHDEQLAFIREYLGEKVLTKQEYLEGQEQIMTALKDLRQEISFTHGWLRRHDENFVKLNMGYS